jgi:hypothetical protein
VKEGAEDAEQWLVLDVRCAECARGGQSLVSLIGVYPTLEDAKAAFPDRRWGPRDTEWWRWAPRDTEWRGTLPGAVDHCSDGGLEIIPLGERDARE